MPKRAMDNRKHSSRKPTLPFMDSNSQIILLPSEREKTVSNSTSLYDHFQVKFSQFLRGQSHICLIDIFISSLQEKKILAFSWIVII